jgi:hypothetical protein
MVQFTLSRFPFEKDHNKKKGKFWCSPTLAFWNQGIHL